MWQAARHIHSMCDMAEPPDLKSAGIVSRTFTLKGQSDILAPACHSDGLECHSDGLYKMICRADGKNKHAQGLRLVQRRMSPGVDTADAFDGYVL